jgi:hypothetical protein
LNTSNVPGELCSTCIVDVLLRCPFNGGRGESFKLLKKNSLLSTVTPRYKRRVGVVSILNNAGVLTFVNCRPELLHKIHTFVTPRNKRRRELQVSALNDTGSINSPLKTRGESQPKIANISSNSKQNLKSLQIPSKGLVKNPFLKNSETKNLIGLSL